MKFLDFLSKTSIFSPSVPENFGGISAMMKKLGVSDGQLAENLGISRKSLWSMKAEERAPSAIEKILVAMQLEWLDREASDAVKSFFENDTTVHKYRYPKGHPHFETRPNHHFDLTTVESRTQFFTSKDKKIQQILDSYAVPYYWIFKTGSSINPALDFVVHYYFWFKAVEDFYNFDAELCLGNSVLGADKESRAIKDESDYASSPSFSSNCRGNVWCTEGEKSLDNAHLIFDVESLGLMERIHLKQLILKVLTD